MASLQSVLRIGIPAALEATMYTIANLIIQIFVNGLGTDGVFWAEPVSNLVGGCACFFTMLATVLPELNSDLKRAG